ncbi:MAG: type II toxin-antitoxin system PrlF family antitoxin [Clostridiales bacterium]|nr:type II toxin-antitoxin system PrlF family antitoxin [Clostridiales bacterium]MCF8023201.1 type II toxin-antitoxin system PrlF family antitoxin [Clostridiales bacterium]
MTKVFTPKIGPKGQMTLPKQIRDSLKIQEGDRILLKVEPEGKVVLEKGMIVPLSIKKVSSYSAEG